MTDSEVLDRLLNFFEVNSGITVSEQIRLKSGADIDDAGDSVIDIEIMQQDPELWHILAKKLQVKS